MHELFHFEGTERALVSPSTRSQALDQDHQLRAFASQVMRVELTEEYEYAELAIDVHDPRPVEGNVGRYDLFI